MGNAKYLKVVRCITCGEYWNQSSDQPCEGITSACCNLCLGISQMINIRKRQKEHGFESCYCTAKEGKCLHGQAITCRYAKICLSNAGKLLAVILEDSMSYLTMLQMMAKVHRHQREHNYNSCFLTIDGCGQYDCSHRVDCQSEIGRRLSKKIRAIVSAKAP